MPGAGQLNTPISIWAPEETPNPLTGETETIYTMCYTVSSMKEDTSGGSSRRGLQVEEEVKTVFTIPFIEGILPSWKVQIVIPGGNGPVYEIIAKIDRDDRRVWSELHCSIVQ